MKVYLGDLPVELIGKRPKTGEPIDGKFGFRPVLNTKANFPCLGNAKGIVFLSTLPNVRSFACSTQVLDLEEEVIIRKIPAKIFHLASCGKESWSEIKKLHPQLKAHGYSLQNCNTNDVNRFKHKLGVGVSNSNRLAHGLFVLKNGKFIASYIPKQQYGVPNIKRFLNRLERSLHS